ncbi:MAG: VCBS repeat-containing protein [Bacteroides sp.]|nr:VCBS repeat-containing protein [Bacteroides sp.]
MKSSTKFFMAIGASALTTTAMAQANFTESSFEGLPQIHRATPIAADFNNDGWLDVYHAGQLDPDIDGKDGIWGWSQTSTFIFNNGDDTFNVNKWIAVQNDEPEKDENGDVILDDEGNPIYNWHMADPGNGVRVSCYNSNIAFDFNNDGLVDLVQFGLNDSNDWTGWGDEWKTNHMTLYKNNGDGTFTMVEEAGFPNFRPDNNGVNFALAAGDYDRDGYVDLLVSATEVPRGEGEELLPGRAVNLYRNIDGTGRFEKMLIADVIGGVWTNEVKDEETGDVITSKQQLEGWFAPVSGGVHFVDLNNDGWLDIISDGWSDDCHVADPNHSAGNYCRIYLNRNGERFEDVTPSNPAFYSLRSSASSIADLDNDGYLDYFMTGWGDNGFAWEAFTYLNNYGYDEDEYNIFADPILGDDQGLKKDEGCRQYIRDFDNDGYNDIFYNNGDDYIFICYGSKNGKFTQVRYDEEYGQALISYDKFGCVADFNNNGMPDIFHTGWATKDRLYYNDVNTAEAPATPQNVTADYEDGILNISWDYDVEAAIEEGLAYNVYVKNANSIYSLIPADTQTGFLKVAEGKHVAIRPTLTSYSIKTSDPAAEVGVQAISLRNETYSAFTKATTAGVKEIMATTATLKVKVDAEGVLVAGNGEEVVIYDSLGRKVAQGVAGQTIKFSGRGIFMVTSATGKAKIVK